MDTNVDKVRVLVDGLLEQLAERALFAIGGDVLITHLPDGIHILFDAGDTDVVIKFEVFDFRSKKE